MHQCKFIRQAQDQLGVGFTLQQHEIRALQQQLKELQHWRVQQLKAGGVHSLSEPLKEKEQNQEPEGKRQVRLTSTGSWVLQPEPIWPTAATGFQYETTKVPVTSDVPSQAFSFIGATDQKMPAWTTEGNFVFQQEVPAAVSPAPSHPTLKDGFQVVLKQPEAVTAAMAPVSESSSKKQVSVGEAAVVLEVKAELADTPPKAAATRTSSNRTVSVGKAAVVMEVKAKLADTPPRVAAIRSKRQVSPGLNTPQAPAAKKGTVEDSEEEEEDSEEEEEDGTDADVRGWMEAEHTDMEVEHKETEFAEKGAEAQVQGEQEQESLDGYDKEEADREQTRQRGCLMESEGIQREEGARARRGQLFAVESSTMGG